MAVKVENNKVILTFEQEEALRYTVGFWGREFTLKHQGSSVIPNWEDERSKALNGLVLDALAHVIYAGYYLEKDPEILIQFESKRT